MIARPPPLVAVVDDDESVRRSVARLLRAAGYAAETFASGAAFLDSPARRRAAAVILDVNMPGMSGPAVRARMAEAGDPTPVLFVTAGPLGAVRRSLAAAGGAAEVLAKPFDDAALLGAIARAIAGGRGDAGGTAR